MHHVNIFHLQVYILYLGENSTHLLYFIFCTLKIITYLILVITINNSLVLIINLLTLKIDSPFANFRTHINFKCTNKCLDRKNFKLKSLKRLKSYAFSIKRINK
jgi:hypothetical protein